MQVGAPRAVDNRRQQQEHAHHDVAGQSQRVRQALGVDVDDREGQADGREVEVGRKL